MDFCTAWNWLVKHKVFNGRFENDLWIDVVKVNPETKQIDKDKNKNIKIEVWLEHGHYDKDWGACVHNIDLDCGGDTFEEAIIKLAGLVKDNYTDEGILIKSLGK